MHSLLFNAIVKYTNVPDGFSKGLLIPLYKGGRKPRNNKNSYRGITLLPMLSKLLEKCIQGRMTPRLEAMKFPSRLQFAGENSSSSIFTSFSVQEIINTIVNKHGKVFSGFLDMQIAHVLF